MAAFWSKDPFQSLEKSLGKGKLFRKPEDLALYGIDATNYRGEPVAVVLAQTTSDIQETIRFSQQSGLPVTARGAGSGLSGGSVPIEGGIVLSLEKMRAIEPVNMSARTVVVQPGVITTDLQTELAKHRLFYPPDPSSHTISTIGGNVAENAGGLRCFKYGVTAHYVRGIEYVDADGEVKTTGSFNDESFEPDLTPLLVGSEGTLGIFSRIELQLLITPAATVTMAAFFASRASALGMVEEIIRSGIVPSIMEFIDRDALSASAEHLGHEYPAEAQALLLIETDGSVEEAERASNQISRMLSTKALAVETAIKETERQRLWQLRRNISPSLIRLASGRIHEDVAVPRGKLAELAESVEGIGRDARLKIPIYGHAGDGNLHVVILYNESDPEQVSRAKKASHDVFRAALALGGTITGEHGVGCAKRDILSWQLSENVLNLSRKLKRTFDSEARFNPAKILLKES